MPSEEQVLEFLSAAERGQTRFSNATGYDCVMGEGRRRSPSGVNRSEDQELTPYNRWQLYEAGRNLARNSSAVGFAIRKHLDYVSKFTFQNKTTGEGAERFGALLHEWSKPENCDVAGRHSFLKMIRLAERSRTVDGDLLIVKIADGRLQMIEGDKIRTPPGGFPAAVPYKPFDFLHGVQTDAAGRSLNYAVCRRARASDYALASGMFYFERMVPSDACWHHGYFDRFDQIRGVSPLAGSYNVFRDVYEGCDYALAKMKVVQLCGLLTKRESDQPLGTVTPQQPLQPLLPGSVQIYDDAPQPSGFSVDFGRGPFHIDLNKDDDAKFIGSDQPGTSMQEFVANMLELALKGLDIPFSFFRENYTNYSGQRQGWIQYSQSAEMKRADNIDLMDAIIRWRTGLWIEDNELPGAVEDYAWEWVPTGAPWIDPLKEVQADTAAVAGGFYSRTRVCREMGLDFEEVAREIAHENELLEELGLTTTMNPANVQITEVTSG